MIKKITIILFFVILCSRLYSIEEKQVFSKILFYGNTKTKEAVIRRALSLKKGQEFDPEIIEKSRKRLMDLNIFTHVDIEIKKSDEGLILLVIVKEKPSISFSPQLIYAEETYKSFLKLLIL